MKEKYKLFLSWQSVEYKDDNLVYLHRPVFSGPVLKEVLKIQSNDSINLDLSLQYVKTISSWEIAKLFWNKVLKQTTAEVLFDYALIEANLLTRVKLLSNNDSILIDTEKHEESKHLFNLVYDAIILKCDNEPYEGLHK